MIHINNRVFIGFIIIIIFLYLFFDVNYVYGLIILFSYFVIYQLSEGAKHRVDMVVYDKNKGEEIVNMPID